jgi:hypothetical protein
MPRLPGGIRHERPTHDFPPGQLAGTGPGPGRGDRADPAGGPPAAGPAGGGQRAGRRASRAPCAHVRGTRRGRDRHLSRHAGADRREGPHQRPGTLAEPVQSGAAHRISVRGGHQRGPAHIPGRPHTRRGHGNRGGPAAPRGADPAARDPPAGRAALGPCSPAAPGPGRDRRHDPARVRGEGRGPPARPAHAGGGPRRLHSRRPGGHGAGHRRADRPGTDRRPLA